MVHEVYDERLVRDDRYYPIRKRRFFGDTSIEVDQSRKRYLVRLFDFRMKMPSLVKLQKIDCSDHRREQGWTYVQRGGSRMEQVRVKPKSQPRNQWSNDISFVQSIPEGCEYEVDGDITYKMRSPAATLSAEQQLKKELDILKAKIEADERNKKESAWRKEIEDLKAKISAQETTPANNTSRHSRPVVFECCAGRYPNHENHCHNGMTVRRYWDWGRMAYIEERVPRVRFRQEYEENH